MLRRFNVKNFMSFSCSKDEKTEEFSLIPGKVRNKIDHIYDYDNGKLLKFAAIYGANAAGKSNIIKAISCMRNILLTNSIFEYADNYSRIGKGNETKPSYFEAELVIDKKRYSYGFEVILSQSKFISEWLIELIGDDEENVIFERDIENNEFNIIQEWLDKPELKTRLEIYKEEASSVPPSLFLNTMNQKKDVFYENYPETKILKQVYEWFEKGLIINDPTKPVYGRSFATTIKKIDRAVQILKSYGTGVKGYTKSEIELRDMMQQLPVDVREEFKNEFQKRRAYVTEQNNSFLNRLDDLETIKKAIDDGVEDENLYEKINEYEAILDNADKFLEKLSGECIGIRSKNNFFIYQDVNTNDNYELKFYEIKLKHSDDDNIFNYGEESDGTQRLWDILEVLLSEGGKTFIIDELDRCLHPSLTYKFIKDFFRLSNEKDIQLIVTTHESRLLDFDLLRRDEIWFVEKRKTGESDIYSLEDYNERFDKKIDKAYLEGRYGGVPVFTTLFPLEDNEQ